MHNFSAAWMIFSSMYVCVCERERERRERERRERERERERERVIENGLSDFDE